MTEATRLARPRLAISIGCPCGIGPEVSVAAAVRAGAGASILLVGDAAVLQRAALAVGVAPERVIEVDAPDDAWRVDGESVPVWNPAPAMRHLGSPGAPTPEAGAAQLAWVDAACDLASRGEVSAMVTGPVSKDIIVRSKAKGAGRFRGHTEHLQRRLGAEEVIMAFWSERFTTALVTTHLSLARVPRAITPRAVASATYWLGRLLLSLRGAEASAVTSVGAPRPRLAVAGLNPHAGESGLLGTEEVTAIVPGMTLAKRRLGKRAREVDITGPVPAETAFRKAASGSYEGVVAMYHDQATIPMKLVGFGEAVNVSLGLPILRTSVDHGTGYDIAGKGLADSRGMLEAITLATRLSVAEAPSRPTKARTSSPRTRSR